MLLMTLLAAATAAAAPQAAPSTVQDKPKLICTKERVIGSNRIQKVCVTAAEADERSMRTREALDRIQGSQIADQGSLGVK